MSQPTSLEHFNEPCEQCRDKRYVLERRGDRARAVICDDCFETCPACDGAEFVYETDERGYSFAKRCPLCGTLNQRIEAFNEAGIPARYYDWGAAFEHFQTRDEDGNPLGNLQQVKVRINRWLQGFDLGETGFLLHGPVGTGKTHLLAAVVRHLTLEKGISCKFIEFTHLLSDIREQFDQGKGDSEIMAPLAEVPVLAIDELGKGRNNQWQLSIIDEIISKRYNRELTTLFTTNYPIEDRREGKFDPSDEDFTKNATQQTLRERIGERIFSRLYEMSNFLELDAPDFRKRHG
ncbi:MAG: ATP-binding protein [Persicimonas sp.]